MVFSFVSANSFCTTCSYLLIKFFNYIHGTDDEQKRQLIEVRCALKQHAVNGTKNISCLYAGVHVKVEILNTAHEP